MELEKERKEMELEKNGRCPVCGGAVIVRYHLSLSNRVELMAAEYHVHPECRPHFDELKKEKSGFYNPKPKPSRRALAVGA